MVFSCKMKLMKICILLLICGSWRAAAEEDPPDKLVDEVSDSDFDLELSVPDAYNEQIFLDDEAPQLDNAFRRKRDAQRRRLITNALGRKRSRQRVTGGRKRHLGHGPHSHETEFNSGQSNGVGRQRHIHRVGTPHSYERAFGRNRGVMSVSGINNRRDGTLATFELRGSNPSGATAVKDPIMSLPLNHDGLNWIKWLMQSGGAAEFGYKWSGKTPTDEEAMQFMATLFGGKGNSGKGNENMMTILKLLQGNNQDGDSRKDNWPKTDAKPYPPGYPTDDTRIDKPYPPGYPTDDTRIGGDYPTGYFPKIPHQPDFPEDYNNEPAVDEPATDEEITPEIIPNEPAVDEPATDEEITPEIIPDAPAPDLYKEPPVEIHEEDNNQEYTWKQPRPTGGNSSKGRYRNRKGSKGGGRRSYGRRVAYWHPDVQRRRGRRRSYFDDF